MCRTPGCERFFFMAQNYLVIKKIRCLRYQFSSISIFLTILNQTTLNPISYLILKNKFYQILNFVKFYQILIPNPGLNKSKKNNK